MIRRELNEAETRVELINPALRAVGWGGEFPINSSRILILRGTLYIA